MEKALDKINKNKSLYKTLINEKHFAQEQISESLKIVKEFIKQKELIIYGGIAIDYALRLKGTQIYEDYEWPDYDFYSKNFYKDAYELADILNSKGFDNVRVINAIHAPTVRVYVNYESVADISYIPANIYDNIPTLKYKGLNITHPNFQRLDMHQSLSYPFRDPPVEAILHRWKKDVKRLELYNQYYPLDLPVKKGGDQEISLSEIVVKSIKLETLSISYSLINDTLIGGVLGYQLLLYQYHQFLALHANDNKPVVQYDDQSLKFNDHEIKFNIKNSINDTILLVSNDFNKLIPLIKNIIKENNKGHAEIKISYYEPFLDDTKPRSVIIRDIYKNISYEIYDVNGILIPYSDVKFTGMDKKDSELKKVKVANIHYLMVFMLYRHYITKNDIYIEYYNNMTKIIKHTEKIFFDLQKSGKYNEEQLFNIYSNLLIFPNIVVYGKNNYSTSYKLFLKRFQYQTTGEGGVLLPPHYYPNQNKEHPSFDVKNNELFQFSGENTKPFK